MSLPPIFAARVVRDAVTIEGPDAVAFLQGQLSQDVEALAPDRASLSLLLEPQGRLVALLRVTRLADDAYRLDGDMGTGDAVTARLRRYLLRTRAAVGDPQPQGWLVVRGAGTPPAGALAPAWPGLDGYDLPPGEPAPPDVPLVDEAGYERWRVVAGVPRADLDLDERTVPAELGVVEAAASFTKGCYTGQELVARMDSRQAPPPRRLRRLSGVGPPPPRGAELSVGGKVVGTVGSCVELDGGWAALALVGRAAEGHPSVEVASAGSQVTARLR